MLDRKDNEKPFAGPHRNLESLLREFKLLSEGLRTVDSPESACRSYREMTGLLKNIQERCITGQLFEKYELKMKSEGSAEFVLPKGVGFHDLYKECNGYSLRRWGRPAVGESVFAKTANEIARFTIAREIIGVVPGSDAKSRTDQINVVCSQRLLIPTMENAVAAGALYFCQTGDDLFAGLRVRTAGDAFLSLGHQGIEVSTTSRSWEAIAGFACAGTPIIG